MCFVSNMAVVMGLCKHMSGKKYFCSLPLAICIVGARTAELLINADQNPQCDNNGPKTLHCLHFPRARSHCRWVHGLQPYLWVFYCSWGYVCSWVGQLLGSRKMHSQLVICPTRKWTPVIKNKGREFDWSHRCWFYRSTAPLNPKRHFIAFLRYGSVKLISGPSRMSH